MNKVKFFIGDIVSGYTDVMGKQQEIVLVLSLDDIEIKNADEVKEYDAWLRSLDINFVRSDHPLFAITPEAFEAYTHKYITDFIKEI